MQDPNILYCRQNHTCIAPLIRKIGHKSYIKGKIPFKQGQKSHECTQNLYICKWENLLAEWSCNIFQLKIGKRLRQIEFAKISAISKIQQQAIIWILLRLFCIYPFAHRALLTRNICISVIIREILGSKVPPIGKTTFEKGVGHHLLLKCCHFFIFICMILKALEI